MSKEIIVGKNQKRRILSMLGKNFSRIKYVLLLALFLLVPMKSWAGTPPGLFATDGLTTQLFSFWDLRDRSSFVQVTNTGPNFITVHVQIFNANAGCPDLDFYDVYTPGDTHVYDLSNIVANDITKNPLNIALPPGGFGSMVVTFVTGVNGPAVDDDVVANYVLTGNFRVIDNSGYEYRSNSDGLIPGALLGLSGLNQFNFNNVGGDNASDVVGILLFNTGEGFNNVLAGGSITFGSPIDNNLQNFIIDTAENGTSCGDFTFRCNATNFDVGINDALPNSRPATTTARICPGNFDPVGLVDFGPVLSLIAPPGAQSFIFSGFVGLNNGSSLGSMDTWQVGLQAGGVPALSTLTNLKAAD